MPQVIDDVIHCAQATLAGVHDLRKRIKDLEAKIKRTQARSEHWRMIATVQRKEIAKLKRSDGCPSGR